MQPGLERGIHLFNEREFFECHEALEEIWMVDRTRSRLFLQSIIHFAVAFYHHGRQNQAGAVKQLRKGLRKLSDYLPAYEGVNTGRLYEEGARCLELIERNEAPDEIPVIHRSS